MTRHDCVEAFFVPGSLRKLSLCNPECFCFVCKMCVCVCLLASGSAQALFASSLRKLSLQVPW